MAREGRARASFPIDWGKLAPLRLRARALAEGVYAGAHRSVRKGAGVEFGGHRQYVPGDDLRFIDRRALLRHDRLLVREFETETDRALWLCVDATASMSFRGEGAPGDKLAYAGLLAAALARVALSTGDPVGLVFLGGEGARMLPAMSGREAFERVVGALESTRAAGDASADDRAMERALQPVAQKARRGAVIVLLSDLVDLPPRALSAFAGLSTSDRALVVAQVLDPVEADLSFVGTVRLRALEGSAVVEADADTVREVYQRRLDEIAEHWSSETTRRGGRFLRVRTSDDPAEVVRRLVRSIAEARR